MNKIKREGEKNILNGEKGLSPIVTTVLLIALTIGIISIIFFWFRGMVQEGVVKFGQNIELVCDDVNIETSYSSGTLTIVNNGNVPVFLVNIKINQEGGGYSTRGIEDFNVNWPRSGLGQGGTFSANIGSEIGGATSITIYPILIGTAKGKQKTYVCEGQYGKEIQL